MSSDPPFDLPAEPPHRQTRKDRKIPASLAGRLSWKEGEPHPLDVMIEEAAQLQDRRDHALGSVRQALSYVTNLLGDAEQLAQKDEKTDQQVKQLFQDQEAHKHLEHFIATFAVLRRKRDLARLQAANEALHLAAGLLIEVFHDDPFLEDLEEVMREDRDRKELTGVKKSRNRLGRFEEVLHRIRNLLTAGNGWFELFYLPRRSIPIGLMNILEIVKRVQKQGLPYAELPPELFDQVPEEVVPLLEEVHQGEPLSPELREIVALAYYGPYGAYRFMEMFRGPKNTVYLGRIFSKAPRIELWTLFSKKQ
jgi:hypothetical protein